MSTQNKQLVYHNTTLSLFEGLLLGSLAGATAMFLLAPQSGKQTRTLIQQKSIELRDQANEMIEDVFSQVSTETKKLNKEGRLKARQLLNKGQELVSEQLDHVSDAALAGKNAIQNG